MNSPPNFESLPQYPHLSPNWGWQGAPRYCWVGKFAREPDPQVREVFWAAPRQLVGQVQGGCPSLQEGRAEGRLWHTYHSRTWTCSLACGLWANAQDCWLKQGEINYLLHCCSMYSVRSFVLTPFKTANGMFFKIKSEKRVWISYNLKIKQQVLIFCSWTQKPARPMLHCPSPKPPRLSGTWNTSVC